MPAPPISAIPDANALHLQLDAINKAIAGLQEGGSVSNLTVMMPYNPPVSTPGVPMMASPPGTMARAAPLPPPETAIYVPPITVLLDPPITDPETIASLITALQVRANEITNKLVDSGYVAA